MVSRIERLTPEQEADLAVWRDRWTAIGLDCTPINHAEGERVIRGLYAENGLDAPKIVWLRSPLETSVAGAMAKRRSVRESVWGPVWESIWESVRESVGESVRESVGESVRESVGGSVRGSVRESVWGSVWEHLWGQHEAGWAAWSDYYVEHDLVGLSASVFRRYSALRDTCRSLHWFIPLQGIVFASERPEFIRRDERGRLHAESGQPAIRYADGFSVWANHGSRIPEAWGSLPVRDWKAKWLIETNSAEHRRVLLRVIPKARLLDELGANLLHESEQVIPAPPPGWAERWEYWRQHNEEVRLPTKLYRIERSDLDVEPIVLWDIKCPSTGDHYALRVPPDTRTCEEAELFVNRGVTGFVAQT